MQTVRVTGTVRQTGTLAAAVFLLAVLPARADLHLEYRADCRTEPHLVPGLGFTCSGLGTADFPAVDPPVLHTADADPQGDGRYYFRPFRRRDWGPQSPWRLAVRLRVLRSEGSPASTSVQVSVQDRRVILGFLTRGPAPEDDEVQLLDGGTDRVLGSLQIPLNVMRTYVLEVLRGAPGPADDRVQLTVAGTEGGPLSALLTDLVPVPGGSYYGLMVGHPVGGGTGEAEWESLTMDLTGSDHAPLPRPLGTRRQLFLDDWVIDRREGLEREQGEPVKNPNNPVVRREYPWEAARCELYGSAVADPEGRRLQLFYSAMLRPYETRMAYAESVDGGDHWTKPLLDIFRLEGQPTNVVWPGRYQTHGPCVLRDAEDPDPARRYKLFTSDYPVPLDSADAAKGPGGMDVGFSPDGIHWTPSPRNPVLPGFLSDTTQCVIRDPVSHKFVAFVRMWPGGQRSVGRTESTDFETWTPPEVVYTPTPEDRARNWQFYGLSVTPYEGLYVGLVWVLPAVAATTDWKADTPVTWPELAVSRDGIDWERVSFGQPFLPLGPAGSFDHRQIRLASSLVVLEDRILMLYAGSPHPHVKEHNFDIGLASLRLDGFVALKAGETEGTLLSQPLACPGGRLRVNAVVQPGGYVKAGLLSAAGAPLAGYAVEGCRPFQADARDGELAWEKQTTLPAAPSEGLRIRFYLRQARLYSFWIEPTP
jgi:hypothetical protein